MPPKAVSRYSQKNLDIQTTISKYAKMSGVGLSGIALTAGVSPRTATRRLADPSTLSLAELRSLQKTLKIPPEELFRAIF